MQSVAVTGATGFVGKRLCKNLQNENHDVTRIVRNIEPGYVSTKCNVIEEINGHTNWTEIVAGHGCVIHLAARVFVMTESSVDLRSEYRRTNVDGTLNLAKQAAAAGVKRFIYISSIKVNGELTYGDPFCPEDEPLPVDLYGQSKLEAEKGLKKIADETGLEVVIIRPPLVYGPGVKANFRKLLEWVYKGVPLPFGGVKNKRSFIYLDNLTDFIIKCISHPAAAGELFIVSDGLDLSTPDLIRKIGSFMNRSARLLPLAVSLLKLSGRALGRTSELNRICGSLQVDISKAERLIGWHPPVSMDMGLENTVSWFLENV